jgi:hypothetical protein
MSHNFQMKHRVLTVGVVKWFGSFEIEMNDSRRVFQIMACTHDKGDWPGDKLEVHEPENRLDFLDQYSRTLGVP